MFVDVPGIVGFAEAVNSSIYWLPEQYPRWGELNALVPLLGRGRGTGAEPHFHDGHEYWLFLDGLGEAQLGSRLWEVTPNTVVYTPPGVIHRHQMFTPFSVVAAVSRLVGLRRPGHLQLFDGRRGLTVGCEVPSDPDAHLYVPVADQIDETAVGEGFAVPGDANTGPFSPDCGGPLSQLRSYAADAPTASFLVSGVPEFLTVASGSVTLQHEHGRLSVSRGDVVILKPGTAVELTADIGSLIIRASGRCDAGVTSP